MKLNLFILLGLALLLSSCKKSSNEKIKPFEIDNGIYVVGATYKNDGTYNTQAAYWKNNTLMTLNNPVYNGSIGTGIAVSGGNFYMCGFESDAFEVSNKSEYPVFWKNGVKNTLNVLSNYNDTLKAEVITQANFIAADGNNVYIAGTQFNSSLGNVIWINGVPSAFGSMNSVPTGLSVSNGDWYVTIHEIQHYNAAYYKNGTRVNLSSGSLGSAAENIYVTGGEVYVAGYTTDNSGSKAVYWKNGTLTTLSSNVSSAGTIYANNNDVYVGGSETIDGNNVATIWKNGVATHLSQTVKNAYIFQVLLVNNDVYAVGYQSDASGNESATIWKNGVATILGPTPSYAYGIYAVE